MASQRQPVPAPETAWTGLLVRKLRGRRSQQELGRLLGVPKNTVWRWEADRALPDGHNARRLARLADREGFWDGWGLVGSVKLLGDLEDGSRDITKELVRVLGRSASKLAR